MAGYLVAKSGTFAAMTIGLWPVLILAILAAKARVSDRAALRMTGLLAAGFGIAAAPLLAYHLHYGSIGSWYSDVVEAAMALTALPFFDLAGFDVLFLRAVGQLFSLDGPGEFANGVYWIALLLLPATLGLQTVRRLVRSPGSVVGGPLPFVGVFHAIVSLHYEIPVYLYFSSALTLVGVLWWASDTPKFRTATAAAAALAAVGLYFHAGQSLERGIAGTASGALVASVECPRLERSGLRVTAYDCETYAYLIDMIRREAQPGDPILALPSNSELYFLSDRRNPTRFFNSALGLVQPGDVASVTERLMRDPPTLVLYRPADKYVDPSTGRMMSWISVRYDLVETYRGFEVYRRRSVSG
jgi:hypothetical protein